MRAALILIFAVSACFADETLSGYADRDATWVLQTIDNTPFPATATLQTPQQGTITGNAPCNRYSAAQKAPYPWFELGPILNTKRACPDLAAEGQFLTSLAQMTLAEVQGNILILSNDFGSEMTFARKKN